MISSVEVSIERGTAQKWFFKVFNSVWYIISELLRAATVHNADLFSDAIFRTFFLGSFNLVEVHTVVLFKLECEGRFSQEHVSPQCLGNPLGALLALLFCKGNILTSEQSTLNTASLHQFVMSIRSSLEAVLHSYLFKIACSVAWRMRSDSLAVWVSTW